MHPTHTTTKVRGRLRYLGWYKPWIIDQGETGEFDIWPKIRNLLCGLNGENASHNGNPNDFKFGADPSAKMFLVYLNESDNPILRLPEGKFGFSNLGHYLESALQWQNGRVVEVEIAYQTFSILPCPDVPVHTVKFFGEGNSCRVSTEEATNICKIGLEDCCAFLAAGPDGFSCHKFDGPVTRSLIRRVAEKTMRAQRIGDCAVSRREESPNSD